MPDKVRLNVADGFSTGRSVNGDKAPHAQAYAKQLPSSSGLPTAAHLGIIQQVKEELLIIPPTGLLGFIQLGGTLHTLSQRTDSKSSCAGVEAARAAPAMHERGCSRMEVGRDRNESQ